MSALRKEEFHYYSVMLLKDSVKLTVKQLVDANVLQFDLNTLYNKCQIMKFYRTLVVSNFNYNINGEILYRTVGPIKDLDIFFDTKIKF